MGFLVSLVWLWSVNGMNVTVFCSAHVKLLDSGNGLDAKNSGPSPANFEQWDKWQTFCV